MFRSSPAVSDINSLSMKRKGHREPPGRSDADLLKHRSRVLTNVPSMILLNQIWKMSKLQDYSYWRYQELDISGLLHRLRLPVWTWGSEPLPKISTAIATKQRDWWAHETDSPEDSKHCLYTGRAGRQLTVAPTSAAKVFMAFRVLRWSDMSLSFETPCLGCYTVGRVEGVRLVTFWDNRRKASVERAGWLLGCVLLQWYLSEGVQIELWEGGRQTKSQQEQKTDTIWLRNVWEPLAIIYDHIRNISTVDKHFLKVPFTDRSVDTLVFEIGFYQQKPVKRISFLLEETEKNVHTDESFAYYWCHFYTIY